MKTIVLKSTNGQFRIDVKVDLFDNSDAFTVMTIEGRSDAEDASIANLQALPTDIAAFTNYATANNLLMTITDIDPAVSDIVSVGSVTALSMTSTGALTAGTVGTFYSHPLVVVGGNGQYTYAVTTGAIPVGLILDTITGLISGFPTGAESPTFEVTVTDAFGQSDADATLDITIT